MVTPTELLPLPVFGLTIAHGTLLDAVHAQLAPLAAIETVPAPPAGPNGPLNELFTVTLHASAACEITNCCPSIVIVPTRGTVVEFASTE